MSHSISVSVILLAGGVGSRMKSSTPKQFLLLNGKPVALHSFDLFASFEMISEIIVVCDPLYRSLFPSNTNFALPGARRQDSLFNGMQKISTQCDLVCVHDAARPLLEHSDLQKLLAEAAKHRAAALAVPMKCTIKQADEQGFVTTTLDRTTLWEMQTPQVATPALLMEGFKIAQEKNLTVTDEAMLVELTGHPFKLVTGSHSNIKITTPEDWAVVETLSPPSSSYV